MIYIYKRRRAIKGAYFVLPNNDLSFVRELTNGYYGTEGQKSLDPEVFFKLMLIGYLENINSDRKTIEQACMRLDMLFFLGYDIDEELL